MFASLRTALFYTALFLGLAGTFAFLPVWYFGRGLDGQWIGYALGAGALARFFAGPLVASHAAHPSHLPMILRWSSLAMLVIFLLHIPFSNPVLFVILGFVLGAAYAPLIPLTDALVMTLERRGLVHYGPVRSAGSAAFLIGTLICGWLITKNSELVLVWVVGAGILLTASSWFLPKLKENPNLPKDKAAARLKDALLFCLRPDVAMALLVTFLVQASHAFFYGFSALLWSAAGFSGLVIGALFAWGVFFEVVLFSLSPWFRKFLSPQVLLFIGALAALVRWLALWGQPELDALIGWQVLHGFSAAITNLGMMGYLQKHAPERLLAGTQAVNSSLTAGLSFFVGFMVSGFLYEKIGVDGYAIAAEVAAMGVLVCMVLLVLQSGKNGKVVKKVKAGGDRPKA